MEKIRLVLQRVSSGAVESDWVLDKWWKSVKSRIMEHKFIGPDAITKKTDLSIRINSDACNEQ